MFKNAYFVKPTLAIVASLLGCSGMLQAQSLTLARLNRITELPKLPVAANRAEVTTGVATQPSTAVSYTQAVAASPATGAVYAVDCSTGYVTEASAEEYADAEAASAVSSNAVKVQRPLSPQTIGRPGKGPGEFDDPKGIVIDNLGNFYIADSGNNRIQKISPSGTFLLEFGKSGTGKEALSHPYGVALDKNGVVFVADTNNNRIVKYTSDGTYLSSFGEKGSGRGQLYFPQALTLDSAGNVYVADFANNRIQKFTNDGVFLTSWGEVGSKPGQFQYPSSVAIDSHDRVWVTDLMNHRLEVFTEEGKFITTIGSFSQTAADATGFNFPRSVAFAPNGDLWLAQPGIHAVDRYRVSEGR